MRIGGKFHNTRGTLALPRKLALPCQFTRQQSTSNAPGSPGSTITYLFLYSQIHYSYRYRFKCLVKIEMMAWSFSGEPLYTLRTRICSRKSLFFYSILSIWYNIDGEILSNQCCMADVKLLDSQNILFIFLEYWSDICAIVSMLLIILKFFHF